MVFCELMRIEKATRQPVADEQLHLLGNGCKSALRNKL